jgi:hypothetical protein
MQGGIKVESAYSLQDKTPIQMDQNEEKIILTLPEKLPDEVASVLVLSLEKSASALPLKEL